jgi:hypothetical protein
MKKIIIFSLLLLGSLTSMAQCFPDRHSTTWYDGWISCETSANPNTSYGDTHWILYDFGYVYSFYKSTLWNNNEPEHLNNGIQDYTIDFSIDGLIWTNLGDFTLPQATGLSTYEGTEGPDFDGVSARFELLTPTSNYGGSCYGISEIRINIDENLSVIDEAIGFNVLAYPNPFSDELNVQFKTLHPGEDIRFSFFDILGRQVFSKTINNTTNTATIQFINSELHLVTGIYLLKIVQNGEEQTVKIVKE